MWNRKKISEFTPFKSYSHILSDRLTPSVCPTETCPQLAPEHQDLPLAQRHPGPAAASAQGGALHHPTAGGWPHPHGSPPLREPGTREITFSTCMLVSRALMRTLFTAARGVSRPFFLLGRPKRGPWHLQTWGTCAKSREWLRVRNTHQTVEIRSQSCFQVMEWPTRFHRWPVPP